MNTYLCLTPDGRTAEVQADSLRLAAAVGALSLELGDLPRGSLVIRVGGAA